MQNLSIFTIFIVFSVNHIVECCRKSKNGNCCFNHYKNMNGQCLECPLGTIGTNCSGTCPSGYFGKLCKDKCNCADIYCSNIKGCLIHTDHTTSSTETKLVTPESQSKSKEKMIASTWNNLTFTFFGCIGTLFIVGAMCYIKTWFIEMKFRTRGIQFEPPEFYHTGNANITTIQNLENMLNEGQEDCPIATDCPGLAEGNKTMCDDAYIDPQTRNIYNDLNPNNVHKAGQNGVISKSSRLKEIVEHKVRDLQSDGAENIYCRIMLGDEQPQRDDLDEDDSDDDDKNDDLRYEQPWSQLRNYDGNMKNHKIVRKDEESHEKNINESCKCSSRENDYSVEKSASPYSVYEGEFIQGTTDHSDNYTCIYKTSTSNETYTCMNKTREENTLKGSSTKREEQKDRSA